VPVAVGGSRRLAARSGAGDEPGAGNVANAGHSRPADGGIPREGKAVITDPLEADKDLLDRANKIMSGGSVLRTEGGMQPIPRMDLALVDEDQLKTLVLTLVRWVACGNCKVVKGRLPTEDELEASPGRELYDPANTNVHGHPRYVEDVPAWRQQREMAGSV
jgi:hypothetical protein